MSKSLQFAAWVLSAVVGLSLASPVMAADTYKLDPNHTAITWHINHFGFSNPSGKFMNVDGTLTLDEANPASSKVTLTVPVDKIDSGVPLLDEHLKSDKFFDVAKFPTATFTSDKVDLLSKDTAMVHGNLTLHGVTKPVDLKVKLNKIAMNMMNKKTAGFSATGTLKRSDFGMSTYVPNLGDDITLDIESEANLATP
jgi:polyisoprenoid-binding protein YceI